MSFPMYEQLCQRMTERMSQGTLELNDSVKEQITRILSSFQKEQSEQIMFLIFHYLSLTTGELDPNKLKNLYGIRTNLSGKGISLELDRLPSNCLALIMLYCRL